MNHQDIKIEKLSERNELWEDYFKNTIIPQVYVDEASKLRLFTPPAMTQFNLSYNDMGRHITDLHDNFRFPGLEKNIEYVIETREVLEKEVQTTDMRWFQMNIIPFVKKADNKTDGVIITFVEITRRISDLKAQEKLITENAILLDTLSHDLRSPLANMMTIMELLKSEIPDITEETAQLYKVADLSLAQMLNLISELTESRKMEHASSSPPELLNFENILEDVRLTLSDNIVETRASIKSDVQVSQIHFSRRKLRSVLYNLVSNALKFTSPDRKPTIKISTYDEGDFVVISVRDNGMGIKEEHLATIFKKYKRLNSEAIGSGIGLYLVEQIISSEGGKITVQSTPGEGSEFKVYLKAAAVE